MRRILITLGGLGIVAAALGLWITAPNPLPDAALDNPGGDAAQGALVFAAAGCASCHQPEGGETLAGGTAFVSAFGTFYAPNISTDPDAGIGAWTYGDFANAVQRGLSPDGRHYYPAFPYTAYTHMTEGDLGDLWAYMQTLPADATPSIPHDVGFPFNIRRGIGVWKTLFLTDAYHLADASSPAIERGRYLVEGLAHCAECHTPRNALGALDTSQWMAGAPNPSGRGTIPPLSPDKLDWSEVDIAYYLETGFTPEFDSAGGSMAKVVSNMAKLPASDRQAIASYLKALP